MSSQVFESTDNMDIWTIRDTNISEKSENWIEVSVLVELRTVRMRIMTQGDSNLRHLWRDQQP